MALTRSELFALAHQLGHTNPAMFSTTSGARWFMTCDCGWKSTTRRTEADALGAGVHHALTVAKHAARNGANLDTPNRVKMRTAG